MDDEDHQRLTEFVEQTLTDPNDPALCAALTLLGWHKLARAQWTSDGDNPAAADWVLELRSDHVPPRWELSEWDTVIHQQSFYGLDALALIQQHVLGEKP